MKWRVAESLIKLRTQINKAYPKRSKVSDGSIGDQAHSSRTSDHNPNEDGVVCAMDITHDVKNGCDAQQLADALVESRDDRIKYLIWNKRMVSSYPSGGKKAWTWRPYSGSNPHTKHVHISVNGSKSLYDSTEDWALPRNEHIELDEPLQVDPFAKPEPIKNGEVAEAVQPSPKESTTETIKTTVVEEVPGGTKTEETSLVSKIASNEHVKTIASEGVTKLAAKATTALSAGSTASATGGSITGKTWLIVLSIVMAVGAIAVVLFLLWHKSSKEKEAARINSDKDRADVVFEKK